MLSFAEAAVAFRDAYATAPSVFAYAPGRINLIGEHIDYASGCVLPVALDFGVTVAGGPAAAGRIRVHSDQYLQAGVVEFTPSDRPSPAFSAFVHALALETGVSGADLCVVADLPVGRGWSSSAAFAVAVSAALVALDPSRPRPTAIELCQLCQRAETEALGVACGLMDQYVAVHGKYDAAVYFDVQALSHRYVPLHLPEAEIVVVDSGQARDLSESGYNVRRSELTRALDALRERLGDFATFRSVEPAKLLAAAQELPAKLQRRVRHVVTEQSRVERFAELLPQAQVVELGQLLTASHNSLSDDYQVSTPELDKLCARLDSEAGVYGSRLVGGGFGGSVLALVHQRAVSEHVDQVVHDFAAQYKLPAAYEVAIPGDGALVQPPEASTPVLLAQWLPGRDEALASR